jgi:hypothetical protein
MPVVAQASRGPAPVPAVSRRDTLALPAPLAPDVRPVATLALYQPRFVWPPDFRGTHEWHVLREDVAAHGMRTPLRILRNGWVIDGTHRFLIARELGLETVPVQVVPLFLGRTPDEPLSVLDRLRIERTAVREAIGRRHLTRHQVDVLFLTLAEAQASVLGDAAAREARRRANLRVGQQPRPGPTGPTIEELARQYRTHPWRIRQLLALAERGDRETRQQFRAGRLPLRRAYEATVSPRPDELDPVGRYVARRIALLTEMMNRWAACSADEQGLLLDEFLAWLDAFRGAIEALDAEPSSGRPAGATADRG